MIKARNGVRFLIFTLLLRADMRFKRLQFSRFADTDAQKRQACFAVKPHTFFKHYVCRVLNGTRMSTDLTDFREYILKICVYLRQPVKIRVPFLKVQSWC